jgi:hypothetical protein
LGRALKVRYKDPVPRRSNYTKPPEFQK